MTTRQMLAVAGTFEEALPCVRDHSRWGRHRDGCPLEGCSGCLPAMASVGSLCASCFRRLSDLLEMIPGLVRHAAEQRIPVGSVRYDKVRVDTSTGTDAPLPMNVEVDDAINALWSALVAWTASIADELDVRAPQPITPAVRALVALNIDRLPVGVSVASAHAEFSALVRWHQANARAITVSSQVSDWIDALALAVRAMRGRWPVDPPRRRIRCPHCSDGWCEVDYSEPKPPLAPQPFLEECDACGIEPTPAEEESALVGFVPARLKTTVPTETVQILRNHLNGWYARCDVHGPIGTFHPTEALVHTDVDVIEHANTYGTGQ